MNGMTILWVLVAAAVVVIVVALVAGATARRSERRAQKESQDAYEYRHQAIASDTQAQRLQPVVDDAERRTTESPAPDQNLWPNSEEAGRVADDWAARERPVDDSWDDGTHPHDPRRNHKNLRH
jgi:type II secretory pathway pseudopilin PulG